MKKRLLWLLLGVPVILYLALVVIFYSFQEKVLFDAAKLGSDFEYSFPGNFEEVLIEAEDGIKLSSLWFKADSAKGVVLFFRGSGGSLEHWGKMAPYYLENNYDLIIGEYRGYSKSEGTISSQQQFNNDLQNTYNFVRANYPENKILVMGYSLGSGPAAYIAANNNPRDLVLLAPYYSFSELVEFLLGKANSYPAKLFKMIPITDLLRYEFNTAENIKKCSMPVTIFHGDLDEVIPLDHSLRLKVNFKTEDRLIILENQEHNGLPGNAELRENLSELLAESPE